MRHPRGKGVALSADASVIEELNASRVSEDGDKKLKAKEKKGELRKPHAPIPSIATMKTPLKPRNASNETFSSVDIESAANNETDVRAEYYDPYNDTESMISSVSCTSSRRADIEKIRTLLERSILTDNEAPETDDEIVQRLDDLEKVKKTIEEKEAMLRQNLSRNMPNLVEPKASGIPEHRNDRATSNRDVSPIRNFATDAPENKFTNPIARCAAAFSGPKKAVIPPTAGAGRGTIIDFSAFNKRAPGKENRGGRSSSKYSQYGSTTSIDDIDSVFGYD